MPFGELGAFFFTFWDRIFAPREHLGGPFWHLGGTLGNYFGVSGAPWEAILAPRDEDHGGSRMDTKLKMTPSEDITMIKRH